MKPFFIFARSCPFKLVSFLLLNGLPRDSLRYWARVLYRCFFFFFRKKPSTASASADTPRLMSHCLASD